MPHTAHHLIPRIGPGVGQYASSVFSATCSYRADYCHSLQVRRSKVKNSRGPENSWHCIERRFVLSTEAERERRRRGGVWAAKGSFQRAEAAAADDRQGR